MEVEALRRLDDHGRTARQGPEAVGSMLLITRLCRACGRPRWTCHGPTARKIGKTWAAAMSRISDAAAASGSRRLYHMELSSWSSNWYSDAAAASGRRTSNTCLIRDRCPGRLSDILIQQQNRSVCLLVKMRKKAVEANLVTCNSSTSLTPAVSGTHANSSRNFLRILVTLNI